MQRVLSRRLWAFTLLELLVAVLIIGILAAIAIPTFLGQRNRAFETEAISALRNTETAIMTVLAGDGELPRNVDDMVAQLEEIEPAFRFKAGHEGEGLLGSEWDGETSSIVIHYGSIYAAKMAGNGKCYVSRRLDSLTTWQWTSFFPKDVQLHKTEVEEWLNEIGDSPASDDFRLVNGVFVEMPCGGDIFQAALTDPVVGPQLAEKIVWFDDPKMTQVSAIQDYDDLPLPGGDDDTGPGSGDEEDPGSEDPGEEEPPTPGPGGGPIPAGVELQHPKVLGTYTAPDLDNPNDLIVVGGYAYVSVRSSSSQSALSTLNVADPENIFYAAGLTLFTGSGNGTATLARSTDGILFSTVNGRYKALSLATTPPSEITSGTLTNAGGVDSTLDGDVLYTLATNRLSAFDVSDPADPAQLWTLPLGVTDANGLAVAGTYAYVSRPSGLLVVSFFDPDQPEIVGQLTGLSAAQDIELAGDHVYLSADEKVYVVNVVDTANPTLVTTLQDPRLDGAKGLAAAGSTLYVAASHEDAVTLVDISNPASPSVRSMVISPRLDGVSTLYVSDSYVYAARPKPSSGYGGVIVIGENPNPQDGIGGTDSPQGVELNNPEVVGSFYQESRIKRPAGFVLDGDRLYISADMGQTTHSLAVVDISDPTDPAYTEDRVGGAGNQAVTLGADGLLYTVRVNHISIFDLSGPLPTLVGQWQDSQQNLRFVSTAAAGNGVLFTSNNPVSGGNSLGTVHIWDTSDPSDILHYENIINTYASLGGVVDLKLVGNYLFVAHQTGLAIYDVSIPGYPMPLGAVSELSQVTAMEVVGSHVYLTSNTANDSGLYVVDVSSPSNPALVGSKITHADLKNNLKDVVAAGNRLYVASTGNDSVVVFDITSRTAPAHVATVSHQHLARASWLAVDDNYVYALGSTGAGSGEVSNLAVIGEAG